MNKIRNIVLGVMFTALIGGTLISAAAPQNVAAKGVSGNPTCASTFFGLPVWYRGLTTSDTDCTIKSPGSGPNDLSNFIWHIVLNGIDIALRLVGYIAAFLILYGGFLFMTSSGDAAGVAKAKSTITNAVIGLVISIASVAIVNLILGIITGAGSV